MAMGGGENLKPAPRLAVFRGKQERLGLGRRAGHSRGAGGIQGVINHEMREMIGSENDSVVPWASGQAIAAAGLHEIVEDCA